MSTGTGDSDFEEFTNVLKRFRVDRLPEFASTVRQKGHPSINNLSHDGRGSASSTKEISCHVSPEPAYGSYNVVFTIIFDDGLQWAIKIPANGYDESFDNDGAAKGLRSEALTMRLIERETSVLVPHVHAFDTSLREDNPLACPFILMDYIAGIPLYEGWFDKNASPEKLSHFRVRALKDLSAAMVQLNKFQFDQGGSVVFNKYGNIDNIGPLRAIDHFATLQHWNAGRGDKGVTPYFSSGPFNTAKDQILAPLNWRET